MALPLFVLALLWDRFDIGRRRWLRGRMLTLGPLEVHSTTLVSGLLLIAIGALFLRFDGTAGVTGFLGGPDTTELEFALQERASSLLGAVPPWVLTGLGAIAAGAWFARRWHRSGRGTPQEQPEAAPLEAGPDRTPESTTARG